MIGVLGFRGLLGSTIRRLYPDTTYDLPFVTKTGLKELLSSSSPVAIINCLGVVPNSHRSDTMFQMNSEFPRWLFELSTKLGIRLVHVSTDCVFDGKKGAYVETDKPNATTDYGISKAGGEMVYSPHLVVRTSFIGLPDPGCRGLLAWLVEHKGQAVQGFRQARWNGVTVNVLADVLVDLAQRPRIWGLRHIFNLGEPITKYQILRLVNQVYNLGCLITPRDFPIHDRTLSTSYNDIATVYRDNLSKPYPVMIAEMEKRLGRP